MSFNRTNPLAFHAESVDISSMLLISMDVGYFCFIFSSWQRQKFAKIFSTAYELDYRNHFHRMGCGFRLRILAEIWVNLLLRFRW